jgi:hypothetical protein
MSRAFVNEDAGAGETPRFPLPPREDPSYDRAAARALLHGADLGDTASAEIATGYYWGEPKLRALVERILDEARDDGDERLEQLSERFLSASAKFLRPPLPAKNPEAAMTIDRDNSSSTDVNDLLNPHRGEEQSRAREHASEILAHRGVLLTGDETDDELADLWSAVERFEAVVEARGGDTMTNAPDSAEPDNPAFVLPERKAREPAGDYARRILKAASELTHFEHGTSD